MKYFSWLLIIASSFILIFPSLVFGQCEAPFIDCNGLCTLPDECSNGGGGTGGGPAGGTGGGPVGGTGSDFALPNPIQANTFSQIMQRVADIVVLIALPIVVIMIIWAGFLFVTAQGDEKKITTAKTTLWWAVIGALLVIGAKAISLAIENFARQL